MVEKPRIKTSLAEQEIEKLEKNFQEFDSNVKEMTLDRMNKAPKQEVEPQTKLASSEIAKKKEIYLKPHRTIGCQEKFNEKWRDDYNFKKEMVHFIAENKEIIGEMIDIWCRPFPGLPAEWYKVPVNTPVWGPRYLAEQIKECKYHRLIMKENVATGGDHGGTYYGAMAADMTVQRLDAIPVSERKSVFMGAGSF